jgi:hypothetical protein
MTQAITAFFRTRAEGEAAQNALLENGFPRHEVSFLASSSDPTELPKIGPIESTGAESEAAADAFIGSLVGLAAGTAASIVPGMGPLFAAGPFAAAIGGAALGGAFGGLIGLLRDHGVSEQEAEFYAKGVAKGGVARDGPRRKPPAGAKGPGDPGELRGHQSRRPGRGTGTGASGWLGFGQGRYFSICQPSRPSS